MKLVLFPDFLCHVYGLVYRYLMCTRVGNRSSLPAPWLNWIWTFFEIQKNVLFYYYHFKIHTGFMWDHAPGEILSLQWFCFIWRRKYMKMLILTMFSVWNPEQNCVNSYANWESSQISPFFLWICIWKAMTFFLYPHRYCRKSSNFHICGCLI